VVAEAIVMMVVCPKLQQHTKGLLKGYKKRCDQGSQWFQFLQLSLQELYRGCEPEVEKEVVKYKPVFTIELPYEVEKKFFKTGSGGHLVEVPAPLLQKHTTGACFSL
jgi:hypothetical protein